jgi:hypothetical protein
MAVPHCRRSSTEHPLPYEDSAMSRQEVLALIVLPLSKYCGIVAYRHVCSLDKEQYVAICHNIA